ncbi:hypothetical protein [Gulosibacter molinativorax]|uniref:hypothetical protein n=1 Tax=Gulosibacter molinativorax TaxID=256821 RepID=UPI00041812A6|nr:hypothetical protein [Gulosibacter molinativorax]
MRFQHFAGTDALLIEPTYHVHRILDVLNRHARDFYAVVSGISNMHGILTRRDHYCVTSAFM